MFSEAIFNPLSRVVISVGEARNVSGKGWGNLMPGKASYKGGTFVPGLSPISHAKKPPLPDITDVEGTARRGRLEEIPLKCILAFFCLYLFSRKYQN